MYLFRVIMTVNWHVPSDDRCAEPRGGGLGEDMRVGSQSANPS
jgi:hypothetical protein